MPKADPAITVVFEAEPTGIFREVSRALNAGPAFRLHEEVADSAHVRLDQLADTFCLVRQINEIENLPAPVQSALALIETGLRDVSDMLSIATAERRAACSSR